MIMTTSHAVIASGILTLVMLLAASAMCAKAWTPPGMAMFLAVVLAAQLAGKGAQIAMWASVFFWARLVYWPVYIAGIIYLRTAVWFVSIIAILMIAYEVW